MICRYCGAALTVETNLGDPMVRKRDIKSFLLAPDGSTMCRTASGAETLHMPTLKPREDPVTTTEREKITMIELGLIDPAPDNPRGAFELPDEFVASIKEHGILVPITLVPRGDRFEVVFGHRRHAGAAKAELLEVPAEVRYDWETNPKALYSARIVEAIHREGWSDLALARAFKQLEDLSLSQRRIGDLTGFNQSTVSRHLALLELPEPAQLWLTQGEVTQEEALFIGKLPDEAFEELVKAEDADERRAELDGFEFAAKLQEARDKKIAELEAAGVVVLRLGEDERKGTVPLAAMPWVNIAKHRKGECRAVVVEIPHYRDQSPKVVEYCTKPRSHPRPTRHEDGATKQAPRPGKLEELVEQLEAATVRRHEFLAGIVPDPLEVLTELVVEEFGLDKDQHLLNALGVESIGEVLVDAEGAIKVLWLADVLNREQPDFTWRDAFAAPRSPDTFVLTGQRAAGAVEILDELRELGYDPSPIELYRAGQLKQLETLPGVDEGPEITIEVRLVRGYHVAVCSTCGAVAKGSKNEEASRLKGVDHLWEIHGIGSVTPIDGGAATS